MFGNVAIQQYTYTEIKEQQALLRIDMKDAPTKLSHYTILVVLLDMTCQY